MVSRVRHGGRFSLIAAVLVLGIAACPVSTAMAHGGGGGGGHGGGGMGMGGGHMGGMGMGGMGMGHMGMGGMGYGHMGGYGYGRGYGGYYGGIGFFPGFFGYGLGYGYPFLGGYGYGLGGYGYGLGGYGLGYGGYGLGYGLGYGGYGGYGLGYGGYGGYGYPYYGGYGGYGGYGYPYYGYAGGYGYPAAGLTYSSAYVAPAGSAANTVMPAQGRYLGIDEEPVVDATGRHGMKVTNVYPGTAAQRAGLRVGDVIYSINGYLTEQRGNLAWIIANAAANNQLNMNVKRASDGQERAITAQIQ